MSWFLAPSSTRPTSRIRTILPSRVVRTMILSNWSASTSRPSVLRVTWVCCPGSDRRLADLAGGDLQVLLAEGQHDVAGRHVPLRQLVGVEPDPHAVIALAEHGHVADAGQPRQLVADLHVGVIAQVELVVATLRELFVCGE